MNKYPATKNPLPAGYQSQIACLYLKEDTASCPTLHISENSQPLSLSLSSQVSRGCLFFPQGGKDSNTTRNAGLHRSWSLPFCSPNTEGGPALIRCQEIHSLAKKERYIHIHLQKL